MLDIIGIGSLNLDITATAEKINSLPDDKFRAVMGVLEYGAESQVELQDIESVVSLLGTDSLRAALGGSAFNAILAVAAIDSGIRAGYVGVAGDTGREGLSFVETMDGLSIDRRYVDDCADRSGLCVSINHKGTRSFLFNPGCNVKMAGYLNDNYSYIMPYLADARMLHITQFSDDKATAALARIIRDAKSMNPSLKVSCDPGYCWLRNLTPALMEILKASDFIFLNAIEFNLLGDIGTETPDLEKAGAIFARYELQKMLVIVKAEAEIKVYGRPGHEVIEQRFEIDLISSEQISDSTGAGDLFAAGFLGEWLADGESLRDAVELGMAFMRAKLESPPDRLYSELSRIFAVNRMPCGKV